MYDRTLMAAETADIPVISIGNISVGGTGKTPFAAWIARQLAERGSTPAIVLRGYGDDEPRVHRILNPNIKIIVSPSRVDGIRRAADQGADVAVLDDAFQHRRVQRHEDIVLVSADAWTHSFRLLPAGPWREPLSALSRSSLIVITSKASDTARADAVAEVVTRAVPDVPQARIRFALDRLQRVSPARDLIDRKERTRTLDSIAGKRVLAVAAIADPEAFFAQLEQCRAAVDRAPFSDHHQFTAEDVAGLALRSATVDAVVCTLKDAVKLGDCWPAASTPLWYVSQSIDLESGATEIEQVLTRILTLAGERTRRERTRANRPPDQNPT